MSPFIEILYGQLLHYLSFVSSSATKPTPFYKLMYVKNGTYLNISIFTSYNFTSTSPKLFIHLDLNIFEASYSDQEALEIGESRC